MRSYSNTPIIWIDLSFFTRPFSTDCVCTQ